MRRRAIFMWECHEKEPKIKRITKKERMNKNENEWGIEWKNEWEKYVCNNNKIKICFNTFHKCGFLSQLASQSVSQSARQPVKSHSLRLIPFIIQLRVWVRFQRTVIWTNKFQPFSLEHKNILYYIWYVCIYKKKKLRFSRTFSALSALFGLPTDYSWLLYIFGQFCVLAIVVGLSVQVVINRSWALKSNRIGNYFRRHWKSKWGDLVLCQKFSSKCSLLIQHL